MPELEVTNDSAVADAYAHGLMQRIEAVVNDKDQRIITPSGFMVHEIKRRRPADPDFAEIHVDLKTVDSFVEYVKDFQDEERFARMFADDHSGKILCIIDYHTPGEGDGPNIARHSDHSANFIPEHSDEWNDWISNSEQTKDQVQFAEFIEDHLPDIIDGDVMVKVATGLQVSTDVEWKTHRRDSDGGVNFTYAENINGQVNGGEVTVPQTFRIAIRPFKGGEAYNVECRLRYRMNSGSLRIWYKMLRPERILADAVDKMHDAIKTRTGMPLHYGDVVANIGHW